MTHPLPQVVLTYVSDEICHFGSDAFCLFEQKSSELTGSERREIRE